MTPEPETYIIPAGEAATSLQILRPGLYAAKVEPDGHAWLQGPLDVLEGDAPKEET